MIGYGKILRVNLSAGTSAVEDIPETWPKLFGGARGFGAKILYDEVPDYCDALGEENKLILSTGILAGTNIHAVHRWVATTKSPLTDGYCRTVGGGDFGAFMRFAGYDCIVIEGKSEKPVYLCLSSSGCVFRDASQIWGKNTEEAQKYITADLGGGKNVSTIAIGQTGENKVLFAAIFCGRRSASRGGSGAVMGSKNLKGIGIIAERNLSHLFNLEEINRLGKEQLVFMKDSPSYILHRDYGTSDGMISRNAWGVFPTKNFRYGYIDGWEAMTGEEYRKMRIGKAGCHICGARCGLIHKVQEGIYKGAVSEGPEYESYWSFSGTIGSVDIDATIKADQLCDDYGLDSISTGGVIGFAYELYEKGIITKEDTDGFELNYGNHEAMIELIHKIGRYEGFGRILSMGVKRMAEHYGHGSQDYAMHSKGMELAGYEPRGLKATGYGYATSNIGGAHGAGTLALQEWGEPVIRTSPEAPYEEWGVPFPRFLDRFEDFGKEDVVIHNQNNSCLSEIGVICSFSQGWGGWSQRLFGPMLVAATGIEEFNDRRFQAMMGERIFNLERAFILRQGTTGKDDTLPKRLQEEPLHTKGMPGEGQVVGHLPEVIQAYYKLRGWSQDGIPSEEKLEELGIGYARQDIMRAIATRQS